MSLQSNDRELTTSLCLPTTASKRRLSSGTFSVKRRRISLASVDVSREIKPEDVTHLMTETLADRFIPARPKYLVPFDSTPRTNRIAKGWGLVDDRVLNFKSDASSTIFHSNTHAMIRRSASQLFTSTPTIPATSAAANIARRKNAVIALDGSGISTDPFAYPLTWSTKNYIAIACGPSVYCQNLDSRSIDRLYAVTGWGDIQTIQWGGIARPDLLATGTVLGKVSLCDAAVQKQYTSWIDASLTSVGGIDWSDQKIAVGRSAGEISIYDCRMKEMVNSLSGHKNKVHGVRWSQDGKYLASGDHDGVVYIWDARADKLLTGQGEKGRKMRHQGPVKALAWCSWKPDLLATGSTYPEGIIRTWCALSISPTSVPSPLHTIPLNTSVTSLHWSPHCKELLSTHGSTWSLSPTPVIPTGRLKHIASSLANSMTVHAYPSFERLVSVTSHAGVISHSCLSPDGTKVFTASAWDEVMKCFKVWGVREETRTQRDCVFNKYTIR